MIPDRKDPIEPLVDFDAGLRVAAPAWAREELQGVGADGHRVIVADDAEVLETEDGVRVAVLRPRAEDGLGLGSGLGKACIVACEERGHEGVGGVAISDSGQTQLGDEAILEGAEEPLDPPFRLWAGGRDPLDAQLREDPANLRGDLLSLQLFGKRPWLAAGASEDGVPIRIGGEREPDLAGHVVQGVQVAPGGFLCVEPPGEDLSGGVVDNGVKHEPGAAVFEPGVVTAVELDEHAGLRHPVASRPMAWGPTGARAAQPGLPQEAADGLAGDRGALALAEQFTEVLVVDAGVGGAGQLDDPSAQGVAEPPRGGTTSIAVCERGRAAGAVGAPQATELADRKPDQTSGLGHREFSPTEGVEYEQSSLFTW